MNYLVSVVLLPILVGSGVVLPCLVRSGSERPSLNVAWHMG